MSLPPLAPPCGMGTEDLTVAVIRPERPQVCRLPCLRPSPGHGLAARRALGIETATTGRRHGHRLEDRLEGANGGRRGSLTAAFDESVAGGSDGLPGAAHP